MTSLLLSSLIVIIVRLEGIFTLSAMLWPVKLNN